MMDAVRHGQHLTAEPAEGKRFFPAEGPRRTGARPAGAAGVHPDTPVSGMKIPADQRSSLSALWLARLGMQK
jgi:hypothetical protein